MHRTWPGFNYSHGHHISKNVPRDAEMDGSRCYLGVPAGRMMRSFCKPPART